MRMKPGEPDQRPADRLHVEYLEHRDALERSRAKASKVAKICLPASVAVGVGFVFDLATMPQCGPPAVNPGWFVVGMIGLALAATVAASSTRSRSRALGADTHADTDLMRSGFVLLIVMVIGSVIGVGAAVVQGALGCL